MKTSELLKLLKQKGIILYRHGKKHDLYYSPLTHKTELASGTLHSILKDAGLK